VHLDQLTLEQKKETFQQIGDTPGNRGDKMSFISASHTTYTIAKKHSERQAKQDALNAVPTELNRQQVNMIVTNEMFAPAMDNNLASNNTGAFKNEENSLLKSMKQATFGGGSSVDLAMVGAIGFVRNMFQPSE